MITTELDKILEDLKAGRPVGLPTETVYGLAAPISNSAAIEAVFVLKKRPSFDPLIVHVSSLSMVLGVASEFHDLAKSLANAFWPGPLTLILPRATSLNPMITSGLDTVGIRMPNHPLALQVIELLGEPLAAPSANLFSKVSPTKPEHVLADFPKLTILDGGAASIGIESTVLGFSDNSLLIHRPGGVTEKMLREHLKNSSWSHCQIQSVKSAASPGQIEHHYMPDVPLVILPVGQNIEHIEIQKQIQNRFQSFYKNPRELSLPVDSTLAARMLYEELRQKSKGASGLWFSPQTSQLTDNWTAIWDRLSRAASLKLGFKGK